MAGIFFTSWSTFFLWHSVLVLKSADTVILLPRSNFIYFAWIAKGPGHSSHLLRHSTSSVTCHGELLQQAGLFADHTEQHRYSHHKVRGALKYPQKLMAPSCAFHSRNGWMQSPCRLATPNILRGTTSRPLHLSPTKGNDV